MHLAKVRRVGTHVASVWQLNDTIRPVPILLRELDLGQVLIGESESCQLLRARGAHGGALTVSHPNKRSVRPEAVVVSEVDVLRLRFLNAGDVLQSNACVREVQDLHHRNAKAECSRRSSDRGADTVKASGTGRAT
jgi:hypothetical protein